MKKSSLAARPRRRSLETSVKASRKGWATRQKMAETRLRNQALNAIVQP